MKIPAVYIYRCVCTVKIYPANPRNSPSREVYNEQVNDEPGNYGAGFLGLRRNGWGIQGI